MHKLTFIVLMSISISATSQSKFQNAVTLGLSATDNREIYRVTGDFKRLYWAPTIGAESQLPVGQGVISLGVQWTRIGRQSILRCLRE